MCVGVQYQTQNTLYILLWFHEQSFHFLAFQIFTNLDLYISETVQNWPFGKENFWKYFFFFHLQE